ncbi:LysR family transcriptional regulator [uncultured Tistrella sp.]|uniref:LysR family transcriptional regulator n=1 Tax=Tistrella mobilis TaxID=171437 RepID=UPI000C0A37FC|nr:LysR family transcriptional regulator [uncultured Tistrella sp.]MAM73932.1 LysR family transcriptional regulator [Tistrella sp.]
MDRIDVMRLFTRIVERGSFAQAARDLQIPRPTVTHAIQQLEARLGTRLLERTTRQVAPTLDGVAYFEQCTRLLADLDEVEGAFRHARPAGPLRVDVQGTLARFFVMPALPEFLARYPDISLRLGEGERMVDLIQEGVDCVLRAWDLADSSLTGRRVASLEVVTVASPDYLARFGEPRKLEDLAGHRMVGYLASATGTAYPLEFMVDGVLRTVDLPAELTLTGAELYNAAALAGLGLVQLPRYRFERDLAEGRLRIVLPDLPPPPMPVWVLYPQNRHMPLRVRVFVDWLTEVFARVKRDGGDVAAAVTPASAATPPPRAPD